MTRIATLGGSQAGDAATHAALAGRLQEVRARTLFLVEGLSDEALNEVHDPLMSPIAWDLGHIATFEDLWLVQNAFGRPPLRADLGQGLRPLLRPSERAGIAALPARGRRAAPHGGGAGAHACAARDRGPLGLRQSAAGGRLRLRDGPAPRAAAHGDDPADAPDQSPSPTSRRRGGCSRGPRPTRRWTWCVPRRPVRDGRPDRRLRLRQRASAPRSRAGGVPDRPVAGDERPVRRVHRRRRLPPRAVDRRRLGVAEEREAVEAALLVSATATWHVRAFGEEAPIDPAPPVCHVSLVRGRRLRALGRQAAAHRGRVGEGRRSGTRRPGSRGASPGARHPGRASAGEPRSARFGPSRRSVRIPACRPYGVGGMVGDVWEWTASDFEGYPGFRAFPYREYSEEFFGGPTTGCCAAGRGHAAGAVRNTFRNWDYPHPPPDLRRLPVRGGRRGRRESVAPSARRCAIDVHCADRAATASRTSSAGRSDPKAIPPEVLLRRARAPSCSTRSRRSPSTTPRESSARSWTRRGPRSCATPHRGARRAGAGLGDKTALLDAMLEGGRGTRYVPVDVSESAVEMCAERLSREYAGLEIHGLVGDFEHHLDRSRPPAGAG